MQRVKQKSTTSNGAPGHAEVLTLAEAATYLRLPESDVLRVVREQGLTGRQIGDDWRFLKSELQRWLTEPQVRSGKEALLALAGVWKDDPDIDEIVREAMVRRGRPAEISK